MYCHRCGAAVGQDARFCQSCGNPRPPVQPPTVAAPTVPQAVPKVAQAAAKVQKPSQIFWIVGAVLLVVSVSILGRAPSSDNSGTGRKAASSSPAGPSAKDAQFNALRPSEHLTQAMAALKPGATPDQIEGGLRHLNAIPPSAPEAARAKSLTAKLTRAQHLAEAQFLIDSASVDDLKANLDNLEKANDEIQAVLQQNPHDKDALRLLTLATNKGREALGGSQQTREAFAQDLQQRPTSTGYNINVWVHGEGANSGHELNLDSEMFKDTASRVQFIGSVLPAWKKDLCKVGFRQVKLWQGGTFELGQDYSLGCN